jgi:hypothetical protein
LSSDENGGKDEMDAINEEPKVRSSGIEQLANEFLESLGEKFQPVFCLMTAEATLDNAAEWLGLNSPQTVFYRYKKANEKLKEFCSLKPGLSDLDCDKGCIEDFVSALKQLCDNFSERLQRTSKMART